MSIVEPRTPTVQHFHARRWDANKLPASNTFWWPQPWGLRERLPLWRKHGPSCLRIGCGKVIFPPPPSRPRSTIGADKSPWTHFASKPIVQAVVDTTLKIGLEKAWRRQSHSSYQQAKLGLTSFTAVETLQTVLDFGRNNLLNGSSSDQSMLNADSSRPRRSLRGPLSRSERPSTRQVCFPPCTATVPNANCAVSSAPRHARPVSLLGRE